MRMHMRATVSLMVTTFSLVSIVAAAQQPPGTGQAAPSALAPTIDFGRSNFADFGLRGTAFDDHSDKARFQRYRNLGNGATLDVFRYTSDSDHRLWNVQADHV